MLTDSLWEPSPDRARAKAKLIKYQLDGVRLEVDPTDADGIRFEECGPVRDFPSWPHKRFYSGRFWMSRTGGHVAFESFAERQCLMDLDRIAGVAAVASQPMWIEWDGLGEWRHAPDYFVRSEDGTATVIDVRPLSRIDAAAQQQFDRTAALSRDRGWQYCVYAPDSSARDANLRFLLRYRDEEWSAEHRGASIEGSISAIARELDATGDGLALCFAAIWAGKLEADLDQPLSLRSVVRWKETL
jgi:hypothetical protein